MITYKIYRQPQDMDSAGYFLFKLQTCINCSAIIISI